MNDGVATIGARFKVTKRLRETFARLKEGKRLGAFRSVPGFGPATRKAIYTKKSIMSLNYQLRKVIKTPGHFPNETAAIKLL